MSLIKNHLLICSLTFMLASCTISDTYKKIDVGPNNVGTEFVYDNFDNEIELSGVCPYLFGIFKLNNDCSPDKIANKFGIKTITQVNTNWKYLLIAFIQTTQISGY